MDIDQQRRFDRRGVGSFLLITFSLTWLLTLPMWLGGQGVGSPGALILIRCINFMPTLATLVVVWWISPLSAMRRTTGLRWGAKGSRWALPWLFGMFGMTALTLVAPFSGALLGRYALDLQQFSGFRAFLASIGQPAPHGSIAPLAWQAVLSLPLQTLMFAPLAFGEEWGWRGYLLPQLLPLGQWRALLISGIIWGAWHAPFILLGANYPGHPLLGVLVMVCHSTIVGVLLGWTRLATGSVWPAVLGHAALDASIPVSYLWSRAGATYDPLEVTITGWTGWILPLLFIAFLALIHRLPVLNAPDLAGSGESARIPSAAMSQAQV